MWFCLETDSLRSNQIKIQSCWISLAGPSFTDWCPYKRGAQEAGMHRGMMMETRHGAGMYRGPREDGGRRLNGDSTMWESRGLPTNQQQLTDGVRQILPQLPRIHHPHSHLDFRILLFVVIQSVVLDYCQKLAWIPDWMDFILRGDTCSSLVFSFCFEVL